MVSKIMVLSIKLYLIELKQAHICIAAACGENVILNNIVPKHVETLTAKFSELV